MGVFSWSAPCLRDRAHFFCKIVENNFVFPQISCIFVLSNNEIISIMKKSNEIFKVKLALNYYDLSLDDKLEICRNHGGSWVGASYDNGVTTILLKAW